MKKLAHGILALFCLLALSVGLSACPHHHHHHDNGHPGVYDQNGHDYHHPRDWQHNHRR